MELILFIVLAGLLFPSSGGGTHIHGSEIFCNLIAAVGGIAILAVPFLGVGWAVYQLHELVNPAPGSALSSVFLVALLVCPIFGLFAFVRVFAAVVKRFERHA